MKLHVFVTALFGLFCLNTAFAQSASSISLSDQQAKAFTLTGSSFTTAFFFDVPAGTNRFKVELIGNASSGDIDLFLRQGKNFLSKNSYDQALSFDELAEYAQYWSISADAAESILVTSTSVRPPVAGRYFVSVFNGDSRVSTATLKLTLNPPVTPTQIQVRFDLPCATNDADCKCDLAPWNDTTNPTGFNAPGNVGVNLGQKRRNALLATAQQLANQISSEAPIVVQACWADLGAGDVTTLAQAGPESFAINDPTFTFKSGSTVFPVRATPFLPRYTWVAVAPTGRALGAGSCKAQGGPCGTSPDLRIIFNSLVDTPQALGARSFYYGTTASASQNIDFGSVAMHEMTHGLGYLDLLSDRGEELRDRDDAYSRNLINAAGATPKSFARLNDAERLAALTSNNVQWVGLETLIRSGAQIIPGERGIRMHAPTEFSGGSSIGHLDFNTFSTELMAPRYSSSKNLGIAAGQLADLGWSNSAKTTPPVAKFYAGNWFDPTRSGHGFDIEPAGNLGGFERALVTSYTYDAQGLPEYYISIGEVVDGVFLAATNTLANGASSSLGRFLSVNGTTLPDPAFNGRLRMDFNAAANSFACTENGRTVNTTEVGSLSLIAYNAAITWCIQPLIEASLRSAPASDFTGHWYDESNPGWGLGIQTAVVDGKNLILIAVYYPDAAGNPRWAYAFSSNFSNGDELDVFQRNGFCRTCAVTAATDVLAGKLKITLGGVEGTPGQNNQVSFNVTFQGPAGGTFTRSNAKLVRLVERAREIQ